MMPPVRTTDRNAAGTVVAFAAALVTGVIASTIALSFAVIVYAGPLARHLSEGIALTMLGSAIMIVLAPFLLSYRGTIFHLQDVTGVLIAIAAASIAGSTLASGAEAFPTVVMFVVATSVFTGIVFYLCGHFRLGFIARFAPYPVLGGFLAATGYLLTLGALGMMLRESLDLGTLRSLLDADKLVYWAPWMAVSAVMVLVSRKYPAGVVLPVGLAVAGVGFYAVLLALGISLEEALDLGLMLGPFEEDTFAGAFRFDLAAKADWGAIALQAPTMVAVAAMAVLGALLNASGIELTTHRELDFEKDLKGAGVCNVAGGLFGGLVGYHTIGETVFLNRVGMTTAAAGLTVFAVHVVILAYGAGVIEMLPMGLVGMVIGYLGLDLLITWLWIERRKLPAWDFGIVVMILAAAATIGFLQALALGVLAAAVLFILSYARTDIVRLRTTLATRRSTVERGPEDLAHLAVKGNAVPVFELTGFLFFGTANGLVDKIREDLARSAPRHVIVDFTRVTGLDASAAFSLMKLAEVCAVQGTTLHVSGMSTEVANRFDRIVGPAPGLRRHPIADDALLEVETGLLQDETRLPSNESFPGRLNQDHPGVDLSAVIKRLPLGEGDVLIEQGTRSQVLYSLVSGELRAEIEVEDGRRLPVARFLPGALVGEIAHYADTPRTAWVVADRPSEVVALNLEAIPDTPEGRALAADIHRHAAGYLARRLMRTTHLLRDAGV